MYINIHLIYKKCNSEYTFLVVFLYEMYIFSGRRYPMRKPKTALGQRIRRLRQEKGWTQEDLERESGISQVYISRLESGATATGRVDTFSPLAKALGVTME